MDHEKSDGFFPIKGKKICKIYQVEIVYVKTIILARQNVT